MNWITGRRGHDLRPHAVKTKAVAAASSAATAATARGRKQNISMFRWFLVARAATLLATSTTAIAVTLAVISKPQLRPWLGTYLAAEMIPLVVGLVLSGALADRFNRRNILIISATVAAGGMLLATIALSINASPVVPIIPLAINGCATALGLPALRGILTELVPAEGLQKANAKLSIVRNLIRIGGPLLASLIASLVSPVLGMYLAVALNGVAAICMIPVKTQLRRSTIKGRTSIVQDIHIGWREFWKRPWIWSVALTLATTNGLYVGAWQILSPISLAENDEGAIWGALVTSSAIGTLLSSAVLTRINFRGGIVKILLGTGCLGLPIAAIGAGAPLILLLTTACIGGAGIAVTNILWDSELQSRVPEELISRVTSLDDLIAYALIPIAQMLALPIATTLGLDTALLTAGAGIVAITITVTLATSIQQQRNKRGQPSEKTNGTATERVCHQPDNG